MLAHQLDETAHRFGSSYYCSGILCGHCSSGDATIKVFNARPATNDPVDPVSTDDDPHVG